MPRNSTQHLCSNGRGRLAAAIFSCIAVTACPAAAGSAVATTPETQRAVITVRVRNTAEVPPQILGRASLEAQRIFHAAGVETEWLLCSLAGGSEGHEDGCHKPQGPADLNWGIVPLSMEKNFQVSDSAYGVAIPSLDGHPASYAYVLYGRVEKLIRRTKYSGAIILAHVMVHEVGHLLLGPGHAPRGLMGANWDGQALLDSARGVLKFSSAQARRLQAEAGARRRGTEATVGPALVAAN